MDVITLDGDCCSCKGAMTGGFVDTSKSRLLANSEVLTTQETLRNSEDELRKVRTNSETCDTQVTSLISELQGIDAQKASLDHVLLLAEEDIEKQTKRIEKNENQMKRIKYD